VTTLPERNPPGCVNSRYVLSLYSSQLREIAFSLALILGVHRPVLGKEIGPEEVGLGFAATDETGTLAVDKDFRGTATAIVV
jgi:hypothetical protein